MIEVIKRRAYFIGGISGVGKSAILNKVAQLDQRFEIVHGSEHFIRWLGLQKGDYNALRSLPNKFKNKELDKMMRKLVCGYSGTARCYRKPLLIDAHYLRIYQGHITLATSTWVSLFYTLFLITADAETVFKRINRDFLKTNKDRKLFPEEANNQEKISLLEIYHNKTTEAVKKLSYCFRIPYFIVQNEEGMLEQAAKELIKHIEHG